MGSSNIPVHAGQIAKPHEIHRDRSSRQVHSEIVETNAPNPIEALQNLQGTLHSSSSEPRARIVANLQKVVGNRQTTRFLARFLEPTRTSGSPAIKNQILTLDRTIMRSEASHELSYPLVLARQANNQPTNRLPNQAGTNPSLVNQALYAQAVASLASKPGGNANAAHILQLGQIGRTVPGVQTNSSTASTPVPPSPGGGAPPQSSSAFTIVFDLKIIGDGSCVPAGAAAAFFDDPAHQTTFSGTAATGQKITRLLVVCLKMPTTPNPVDLLAEELAHEGIHMLLAMDNLLNSLGPDPGLAAGLTGAALSFSKYQQAGKQSPLRPSVDAGLVGEINRVIPPLAGAPSQNSAVIAAETVDGVLEERFAIDQQQAQFTGRPKVTNQTVASAYLLQILGKSASHSPWPPSPSAQNLTTLFAQFLDNVAASLAQSASTPTQPPKSSDQILPPGHP